jgi:hypothetical protein
MLFTSNSTPAIGRRYRATKKKKKKKRTVVVDWFFA